MHLSGYYLIKPVGNDGYSIFEATHNNTLYVENDGLPSRWRH